MLPTIHTTARYAFSYALQFLFTPALFESHKIEKAAAVMHQLQKPQNHVSVCFMELSLLLRFFASAGKQVSLFYVSSYLVHFKTINTLRSLMRVQAADF